MYRVLVVDDEPAAVQHICAILERKCPGYVVAGTAENGRDALDKIEACQPDVVVSDVKMPVMDGIRLVSALHESHPEIMSVIVSGYQDFEFAKGAIRSGVCDYLLKPLAPSDLQALMQQLEDRLTALYYRRRTEILKAMCSNQKPPGRHPVEKYFPASWYYAVLLRKNGLPKRFTRQTGIEFFSTEEEKVLVYGRDEMEALYVFPEDQLPEKDFDAQVEALFAGEQSEYYYVTAVMHPVGFGIRELPQVVSALYHRLDLSVTIGRDRLVKNGRGGKRAAVTAEERAQKEHVENLIRYRDYGKLLDEIGRLFDLWEAAGHNQIYTEAQIRYILQALEKQEIFEREYGDYNFIVDDCLHYVADMQSLKLEICELLRLLVPALAEDTPNDQEQLFNTILAYIEGHISEPLTIGTLCRQFNISQATLSRWFRKYKETSFGKYLTEQRIEMAKQIIRREPTAYLKDVAEWVGYVDQFYFSRIFRSVVGLCPKDYAEQSGGA